MAKRRHTPEQVIKKLREAEVAIAEDVVRERLIHGGHRADVSALAARKIAVRALRTYIDQLDSDEWVDSVLDDALDAAEEDERQKD